MRRNNIICKYLHVLCPNTGTWIIFQIVFSLLSVQPIKTQKWMLVMWRICWVLHLRNLLGLLGVVAVKYQLNISIMTTSASVRRSKSWKRYWKFSGKIPSHINLKSWNKMLDCVAGQEKPHMCILPLNMYFLQNIQEELSEISSYMFQVPNFIDRNP